MTEKQIRETLIDAYFGEFGGQYVPDLFLPALDELEKAYVAASNDPQFLSELQDLYENFLGRPTPITECANLPLDGQGKGNARIFLKREDLVHGGAHKGNQTIAQALLAKRLGKTRLIAETGAGQHGTATAMVAALMGMKCTIYMGAKDVARQQPNVYRMRLMGAEVVPVQVEAGNGLSDAINVALTDWAENLETTHYLLGTAAGPHPFPKLVKDFQSVISRESKEQMLQRTGSLPDAIVAAAGGGSNAIGAFANYLEDKSVRLIGVEPGGEGLETGKHGAPLCTGRPAVLHGSKSYVMLDSDGNVMTSHSVSAGLDYPGIGPEHAYLLETGRAEYVSVTDAEALQAFRLLCRYEGIIPALESSHALAYALKMAANAPAVTADAEPLNILVNLSGRGDKDVEYVRAILGDLAGQDPATTTVAAPRVAQVLEQMTAESNAREGIN